MGCLKLPYDYEGEALEKLPLKILGGLEEKRFAVKFCDSYLPFGMTFNSYNTGLENLYKFTGKESQPETGWVDFGARMFDASIGRWNHIDALADRYSSYSPYNYTLNNPIKYIDPDGMRVSLWDNMKIKNQTGETSDEETERQKREANQKKKENPEDGKDKKNNKDGKNKEPKTQHQISAGYEGTAGVQGGLGFKGGANVMLNFGSIVHSQGEIGNGAENYDMDGYDIGQQEFSFSYYGGFGYKRTFQFDDPIGFIDGTYAWEKHEFSVGLFGVFSGSLTFDENWNLIETFKGIELKLEGAAGWGGSAWFKNGQKKEY